ncbi:anti-sigma factor family protein [Pseudochelatococcus sp. G4_1912]|uniref:anti-sigma factor family protein n=1 Tax=Pseudochelatococcus sp. G4_1912 TaxID=3114288 RepID=UPI0039C6BBD8
MTLPVDPIIEADLQGYIDEQLPVERRIAVEAHLAARPELAARIMQDLRLRDELKLALFDMSLPVTQPTQQAARKLARALSWRKSSNALRRIAAIGVFLMLGWFAHAQYGALGIAQVAASGLPPAFVEEALARYDHTPPTNTGAPYDPRQILTETAIHMPALPEDWRVDEVVIAPSVYGPAVGLRLTAPDFGNVTLIAARPGVFDVVPVTVVQKQALTIAHWQIGDVAYALIAQGSTREIDRTAERMLKTLY